MFTVYVRSSTSFYQVIMRSVLFVLFGGLFINSNFATHTFELDETRDGLFVRAGIDGDGPRTWFQIVTESPFSRMWTLSTISAEFRYIELERPCGNVVRFRFRDLVLVEGSRDSQTARPAISIAPASFMSDYAGNTMLVPPSTNHPRYRLLIRVTDPRAYCVVGSLGFVPYASRTGVRFQASVSLMDPSVREGPERALPHTTNTTTEIFLLSTSRAHDVIPEDTYNSLLSHIERVAGVENIAQLDHADWTTFLHLLPSIEYTIQSPRTSSSVRLIVDPVDYVKVRESGGAELNVVPITVSDTYYIGLNTLRLFGVYFDYANRQIGFCDPL